MAAESSVPILDPKIVAEELLAADIRIPVLLCMAVQAAAMKVTGDVNTPFIGRGTCVYPIGSSATNRLGPCKKVDEKVTIEYYPKDLMIIGGMALAFYDHIIRDIKISRDIPSLKHVLTKNTSDIDMVWWPRTNQIITINSPGIMELRDILIEKVTYEIENTFSRKDVIEMILSYIDNAQSFTTEVSIKDIPPIFGAIHICINFVVTYTNVICAFAYHFDNTYLFVVDHSFNMAYTT
jgi:hypothetical protein